MSNINLFEPSQKRLKELENQIYSTLIKNDGLEELVKELEENDIPAFRLLELKHLINDNALTVEALRSLKDAICKTPEVGSMPVIDAIKFLNNPSLIYGEIKKREQDMETILTEVADVKYCLPTSEIIFKTITYTAVKNELVALTQLANSLAATTLQDSTPTPKPISLRDRIRDATVAASVVVYAEAGKRVCASLKKQAIQYVYNDNLPEGITPNVAETVNDYNAKFKLATTSAFVLGVNNELDVLEHEVEASGQGLDYLKVHGQYEMPDKTELFFDFESDAVVKNGKYAGKHTLNMRQYETEEMNKAYKQAVKEALG